MYLEGKGAGKKLRYSAENLNESRFVFVPILRRWC